MHGVTMKFAQNSILHSTLPSSISKRFETTSTFPGRMSGHGLSLQQMQCLSLHLTFFPSSFFSFLVSQFCIYTACEQCQSNSTFPMFTKARNER